MTKKYNAKSKDEFLQRVKEYDGQSLDVFLYNEFVGEIKIPVLLTNEEKGILEHSYLKYLKTKHFIRFEAKTPYEELIEYIEEIPNKKVTYTGSRLIINDSATLESEPYDESGPEAVSRSMQEAYNKYIRNLDCEKVRKNMLELKSELKIPIKLVDFEGRVIII